MRSIQFKSLLVLGLAVLFITGCQTAKKTDNTAGAGATGNADSSAQTPVVSDKDISNDPLGSDGGKIAGLNTINFDYDKSSLSADARKKLAENAQWIKGHANMTVQIEGHTDARGSVEYNLALGERRAKSVKSYLESIGVDAKRMTVISYGKEKPLAEGDSESAYAKNRRANFVPIQ